LQSLTSSFTFYLIIILVSLLLGMFLRTRIDAYRTKTLIRELEKHLGQKLPGYKKNRDQINWEKVLKMLKNEPTTQQVANWRQRVKDRIRAEERGKRTRKR